LVPLAHPGDWHDDQVVLAYVPSARAASAPAPDDLCAAVADHSLMLAPRPDGGWHIPTVAQVPGAAELTPIGAVDGRHVWAANAPATTPDGLVTLDWSGCLAQPDTGLTALAARAVQVITWRGTHRYCGACRTELTDIPGLVGRTCPGCGTAEFAKAQPVALVAVWRPTPDGGRAVLLAKHTYGARHLWALVGGYVDPAESLEQAAHREVAEEVGLTITDLTYYGSEAWGVNGPTVLLSVFTARSADPAAEPVVDGVELAEARFFPLTALPAPLPHTHIIAGRVLTSLAPSLAPSPANGPAPSARRS
jgi:NAD+ diphosphatase